MAKKEKNELSYLQMPLPQGRAYSKMTKRSWSGLNYRQTIDTGALSMENNISTLEAPYLTPSPKRSVYKKTYEHPIDMFGFDDFLLVLYRVDDALYIDYITSEKTIYKGTLKASGATEDDEYLRSIVQFNVCNDTTDPLSCTYSKKILIFPDKKSMDFEIKSDFIIDDMEVIIRTYSNSEAETDESGATIYPPPSGADRNSFYRNTASEDENTFYRYCQYEAKDGSTAYGWRVCPAPVVPNIKYAAVHASRLFGVGDDCVYASGYNNYANWNLDTIDEYNESNAWYSTAQSNTKAGGKFTGITNFQGHIVCFKRDFMHEVYNTKNPFRIQDIYAEGAIDNRSICDVNGKLIFVSDDNVKVYTGSKPRIISYYLNLSDCYCASCGTDGRNYYFYCEDYNSNKHLFVYDTIVEQWSEQSVESKVISFAHNKNGMFMLCDDGIVYKMDTKNYNLDWSFETDLITNQTVDIKHIKKIQMLADIDEESSAKIDVYLLYDDEKFDKDTSHLVYSSSGYGQKPIRVKMRQTANYGVKIRVNGRGYVRIHELELFVEAGGDLYV